MQSIASVDNHLWGRTGGRADVFDVVQAQEFGFQGNARAGGGDEVEAGDLADLDIGRIVARAGFAAVPDHPAARRQAMQRLEGLQTENASLENAALLADAGVPIAFTSGFEGYVPKNRVILFEAAVAAANGLGAERTLRALTIDAAKILGIADRVGSLEAGKDADVVLFDGDPFEYTSHVEAVLVNGELSYQRKH